MKIQPGNERADHQERALKLHAEVLGFVKCKDVPAGEAEWLTAVSPEGPEEAVDGL